MRTSFFTLLAALAALAAAPAAAANNIDVHVSLEPAVVGVDETATFSIEVHGEGFSSILFRPKFQLDNLEVVSGPSQFEDMRYANGALSRTLRLTWEVRPLGVGRARVHDIVLQMKGNALQLQPREIQVRREPTRPQEPDNEGWGEAEEPDPFQQFFGRIPRIRREPQQPEVFLRSEIEPRRPVVGQQVLYSLYLYTREDISSVSPSGVPPFRGFWVQDIPIPQQIPTEMVEVGGRRYGRVPLLYKALFPLRAGRFKVDSASVDLTIQRVEREFLFGSPIARPIGLRLRTEPQWISVQPLPEAPPGFGGAVGQLHLETELQPKEVRLGEAATLTVRLQGNGNLQGVREPAVKMPPGVTVHPPQQEGKEEVVGGEVRGTRVWKYAVIPERAGRYQLETPEITYFDPGAEQYRVAASPELGLTALPRPRAAGLSGGGERAAGEPHGIRTAASLSPLGLAKASWPRLLPWLFLLPWGLMLAVTLVRRRAQEETATPGGSDFEAALRESSLEERPRQAAQRIEDAWRKELAAHWGLLPETPTGRWRAELAARKIPADVLDELDRLLEDLQYLRHAPQLCTTDSLRAEVLDRSRRLLRRLS